MEQIHWSPYTSFSSNQSSSPVYSFNQSSFPVTYSFSASSFITNKTHPPKPRKYRKVREPDETKSLCRSSASTSLTIETKPRRIIKPRKSLRASVSKMDPEKTKSLSALKIQKVYRGFLVRKKMRKIMGIKTEVDEIEKRILGKESVNLITRDSKEWLEDEMLMALMLRLDLVTGVDHGVRELRKSVNKKVIALLDTIDSIIDNKDKKDQTLDFNCQDQTEVTESEVYTDCAVDFVEDLTDQTTVETEQVTGSDSVNDWLTVEGFDDQNLRKQSVGETVQTSQKAEEVIANDCEKKMEKMMETNERLMNLVMKLYKQNALQTKAMNALAQQNALQTKAMNSLAQHNALQTQAMNSLAQTVGSLEKAIRDLTVYNTLPL